MSHDVESMMSGRGQVPWHFGETGKTGQTVVVEHAPRAAEAIKLAKLNWKVDLEPTFRQGKDGTFHQIPDRFAVTRTKDEQVLGSVGRHYVPLQNAEAFQFLDNLVDDGLEFETAGSLRGGRTIFITAKLPKEILIGGEDAHSLYLFVKNDHRGLDAVQVAVTPIRIVCSNTLNLALRSVKRTWSCPHVGTMKGRLADARNALELSWKYMEAFEEQAEALLATELSTSAFEDFLDKTLTLPDIGPRARETAEAGITQLYRESPTCTPYAGTGWGALNAVGEYFDWVRDTRTDEARLLGSMEGIAVKARDKALAVLR